MNLPRDPRLDDPDWLRRKYWEAGLTTGEIAADIGGGCTQAMVQKAMIRLDIPRRLPGRRPVKDGATRGASADLSTSQAWLLAEYEEWLKSRGYSYTTVYDRVRGGRKILRAYPRGIPTKGDALDALAPADRYSRGTRNAARTIVHSFFDFLSDCHSETCLSRAECRRAIKRHQILVIPPARLDAQHEGCEHEI